MLESQFTSRCLAFSPITDQSNLDRNPQLFDMSLKFSVYDTLYLGSVAHPRLFTSIMDIHFKNFRKRSFTELKYKLSFKYSVDSFLNENKFI